MIPIKKLSNTYQIAQKFFIERSLELVNSKTIDTYRARLHNPKTILQELHQVLLNWNQNKIKRFETVKNVIAESTSLIENEEELIFSSLNKEFFKQLLKNTNKDNYLKLSAAIQLILLENENFIAVLFSKTIEEITNLNKKSEILPNELIKLERLISSLITELLNIGFSMTFLNNNIWAIFIVNQNSLNFDKCFEKFTNLKNKVKGEYYVIFKLIIPKKNLRETLNIINTDSNVEYNQLTIEELVNSTNESSKKFLQISNKFSKHLKITVSSKDYYTVIEKAKLKLYEILDEIFLGYNQPKILIYKEVIVIDKERTSKAKSNPLNHKVNSSYIDDQSLYETIQEKLNIIYNNHSITEDTKQKIKSSIRYLRLGNDSSELEKGFINYWIGLEFVFSTSKIEFSSFTRLIENFPLNHQLIYLKRNLAEFHKDIKRLKINNSLDFFKEDYSSYLNVESSYDFIMEHFINSRPILSFRAYQLKRELFSNEKRKKIISKHKNDLEWNLSRIYRIRNEIIHEAALKPNISRISSHIRYYLTFIIINIIEYLTESPLDMNSDEKITIDDFFILQALYFENYKTEGFSIDSTFKIKNPVEIFSS